MTARVDPEHQDLVRRVLSDSLRTIMDRERVYGSGSDSLGLALAAMFPDGVRLITPDDHARYHLFQQIMAKLYRYAQGFTEGGHEDSIHDAGNYAKLLEVKDRRTREERNQ